jgi:hypothetical protein
MYGSYTSKLSTLELTLDRGDRLLCGGRNLCSDLGETDAKKILLHDFRGTTAVPACCFW